MRPDPVRRTPGTRQIGLLLALAIVPALGLAHLSSFKEIRFDRLGVEDGLSNGSVNAITQDREGFMWFGTEDGLNRYDGHEFVVYRHRSNNPNSPTSSNFSAVMQDRQGKLWLGTWGDGLNTLDLQTGQFTRFGTGQDSHQGFEGTRIEFLFEDSRGDIWIGTESSGLTRYLSGEGRFEHFRHDPLDPGSLGSDSVKAIAETAEGEVWVGTDNGLFLFRSASGRFERQDIPGRREEGSERIRSLARTPEGELWIGTRGDGVKVYDPASGAWREIRHVPGSDAGLSENAVARVFLDSQGMVWIATYTTGLDRFDPDTGQFRHYDYTTDASEEGVSFRRIDAVFEDRGGVLWLGTRGGGINKVAVRQKGFRNYRYLTGAEHALPHPTVRAIAGQVSGDDEHIWLGTDGGGLAKYEISESHFEVYAPRPGDPSGLADGRVWSTLVDSAGRVWAGTFSGGLHLLEDPKPPGRFRRFVHDPQRADSLSGNRVLALLESRQGEIWVGTRAGLNRLRFGADERGSFQRFMHDPDDPGSLSSDHVSALMQDRRGRLWVGTQGGVNILDPQSGSITRYLYNPDDPRSLSGEGVLSLFEDASGTIWVGTDEGGLNRYDEEAGGFQHYSGLTGQPGDGIFSMVADERGQLWLGTSRGLTRFVPGESRPRNFGASDGLGTLNFLRGAAYASRSGELFFGGLRGLVSFRPALIFENLRPPALALTSVRRSDLDMPLRPEQTPDGNLIRLRYDEAFVEFEFAALDFMNPGGNRYAHKLEGVDRDWVETGNLNVASYSGLQPGEYLFRAKAANGDGAWNEEGVSMRLSITPPYWQTWWFRVLALLGAGSCMYGIYVFRVSAIRSKNLQLEHLNDRLVSQIRERNRVETERESLITELEGRNAEMERFTYTVSHDLKSPLITIRGFLGMMREDFAMGRPERVKSGLDKIEVATANMNQMLDELLQLSRVGRVIAKPEFVPFGRIVDDALALARGEIRQRRVKVSVQEDLPVVFVDRGRFTEVLLNLVTNAARFMGDQPHPHIEIGVRGQAGAPVFFVRDNGVGIAADHQQKVFGLFERLDSGTPGTGIGLALVKRIVELHGGEIWIESQGPGTGSTFCFRIDAAGDARMRESA